MPWTPLYLDLQYDDIFGNSLSTINDNFTNIDTYLSGLEALFTPLYLVKLNNLSDLTSASTARTNLQFGDIYNKSEKAGTQANIIFNGSSWTNVSGENRCSIISSFNVSKVVRIGTGIYDIHYNTPLSYIGAIVGSANNNATVLVDYFDGINVPTVNKCRIVTSAIRGSSNFTDCSYINVLCY